MTWRKAWPAQEGWYWFYGNRIKGFDPVMYPVQVFKMGEILRYTSHGSFLDPSKAHGVWQIMVIPSPPKGKQRKLKANCYSCGKGFSVQETVCPYCDREELNRGVVVCPYCEKRFNDNPVHVYTDRGFDWCERVQEEDD